MSKINKESDREREGENRWRWVWASEHRDIYRRRCKGKFEVEPTETETRFLASRKASPNPTNLDVLLYFDTNYKNIPFFLFHLSLN